MLTATLICTVIAISDGDTLTARCEAQAEQAAQNIRVRLAEIDAPEKAQAFGSRARQTLGDLCHRQQAAIRRQGSDRYGRTLARVECQGQDAATVMVSGGMAWVFKRYASDVTLPPLQADAQAARRGLWADASPVAPWDWRAAKRKR